MLGVAGGVTRAVERWRLMIPDADPRPVVVGVKGGFGLRGISRS